MRLVMIIMYLFLIILGVSFAALNAVSVPINLYVTTLTLPLAVLIAVTLGIGLIVGFLIFLGRYWRLKVECFKIRNQLKLTETEIKNLRTMPLKDQP
ncbi:Predicted membrane protein [Legionella busanensis]|uniref:Predicted membrane protein n=1 Tax=Legionella busanensis TaxID=190655 RepID=A0A378JJ71_9GAMM|nr:LapA family protein [Legionella busanensis]STX51356.1 Predicted membrane protein [Legionella busanensis]